MDERLPKPIAAHYFDCRRYMKQGDVVKYYIDAKDADIFSGIARVKKTYKKFVVLSGKHTDITVNRWNIKSVNGKEVAGGCFKDLPSLFQRGMVEHGRVE